MRDYLLIPEAKDEIILYLLKENYLNEERFTRSYIRGKFYIKHWGRNKIKINLKQKKITEKLIQKCFDEIDEKDYEKEIEIQFENYYSKTKGLREYQKKSKTIRYLLSKGFEYQCIEEYIKNR